VDIMVTDDDLSWLRSHLESQIDKLDDRLRNIEVALGSVRWACDNVVTDDPGFQAFLDEVKTTLSDL
jgi:hypothetical protein